MHDRAMDRSAQIQLSGSCPGAAANFQGRIACGEGGAVLERRAEAAAEKYRIAQEELNLKEVHAKNVSASLDRSVLRQSPFLRARVAL